MNEIDLYVDRICSKFNESDKDIQILKEELKSNLYDEVLDLKGQGFSEEESIEIALKNFGEENNVILEMNTIWTRKSEFTLIVIKAAVAIFMTGCVSIIVSILFNSANPIFKNIAFLLFDISWIAGCISFYQYINIKNKNIFLFLIALCDMSLSGLFAFFILFPNRIKEILIIIFGIILIAVLCMKIYFIKNELKNREYK